ncbi:hypothetical protein LTR56_026749, partial [Elasticomyces elasticus]
MNVRGLKGKEEAWGVKHTSTLDTVNNFCNLYADQGKLKGAEAMYMHALKGYEKTEGDHENAIRDLQRWPSANKLHDDTFYNPADNPASHLRHDGKIESGARKGRKRYHIL